MRYFRRADIVLIVIMLFSAIAFMGIIKPGGAGGHAIIEVNGNKAAELPLFSDTSTYVEGPLGRTHVSINNGRVRITESPCPNHICIHAGDLSRRGEIAVCVPNRVVVRVAGDATDSGLDGITE